MADQSRPVTSDPSPTSVYPNVSKECLNRFFNHLIGSALCAGLLFLILWLIWLAAIGHPEFRVKTLTLSNLSISSDYLISGDWDAHFIFRNPHLMITLNYEQIQAILMYKFCSLSNITLPPFMQGAKSATSIRATFVGSFYDVDHAMEDEKSHGVVHFNVWMKVRVKPSPLSDGQMTFVVYCRNLPIAVSPKIKGGTLVGGPKKCSVRKYFILVNAMPPEVGACGFVPNVTLF